MCYSMPRQLHICLPKKRGGLNMDDSKVVLLKGNEAIAHAAIRCGADAFFGYPITPQSEVLETLADLKPWETTGMVVLQAESEVSSINMLCESWRHREKSLDLFFKSRCGTYAGRNKLYGRKPKYPD